MTMWITKAYTWELVCFTPMIKARGEEDDCIPCLVSHRDTRAYDPMVSPHPANRIEEANATLGSLHPSRLRTLWRKVNVSKRAYV